MEKLKFPQFGRKLADYPLWKYDWNQLAHLRLDMPTELLKLREIVPKDARLELKTPCKAIMVQSKAAVTVQTWWRMTRQRLQYRLTMTQVVGSQAAVQGFIQMRHYKSLRQLLLLSRRGSETT